MADETDIKNVARKITTPHGVTPETTSKDPDSDTSRGLSLHAKALKSGNFEQDIYLRGKFARRIFWLVVAWIVFVGLILLLQGFGGLGKCLPFNLDNGVLIALITSTTATVIGLFVVVTRYFFFHDDREKM